MLESIVVQSLTALGFFFFVFDLMYIIIYKKKHKNKNETSKKNYKFTLTRFFAIIGIISMNLFLVLCCLNIFFYNSFNLIFPRINLNATLNPFQISGFFITIVGDITLFFSYKELGTSWAYPIDDWIKVKKLVKTGIYSKIRHPIYLSFNIISIGFNLILFDWTLLILYLFGAVGLYIQAIIEERLLIEYFGNEYLDYMKKTKRFL